MRAVRPGRRRLFLNNAAPVRDASGAVVAGVVAELDVTERFAAEAALAAKEAQLRTILETVPVGIVLAELPSGRIVEGNGQVERMLRHPVLPSPDVNSYDEWVSYHADGSRVSGHEYPLARMVLHGEEAPEVEVHYQRGDGTRAWTRVMGRPVRNDAGELVGGVVALVDIDVERRAQEALMTGRGPGAAGPGAHGAGGAASEDGEPRAAHRRRRARLQQPAPGHQ